MKSVNPAKPDTMKALHVPDKISMTDLTEILGTNKSTISRRSEQENWAFSEIPVRGGLQKVFPISTLPPEIRKKVKIHFGEIPAELAECVPADFDRSKAERCSREWDAALDWQKERARARLEILQALDTNRSRTKKGRRAAVDVFVEQYRQRRVIGLDPVIYDQVEKVSRSQIYEWDHAFNEQGIAGLISKHGHTRGTTKIPLDQQRCILGWIAKQPHLRPSHLAESLSYRFNGDAADRRQIAAFLKSCRQNDPAVFCFLNNPDEYRSKYELAWGDADEQATHFLHWVEVDSTPADVFCNDGKKHTIIGLIDVFSRKAKFLVTKTSNSWAIAGVLRATILDWGIPENVKRDNGKDYDSKLVNEGLQALQINVVNAPPFTPRAKPHIERVFRTLAHRLFERMPGYAGHNVAQRKAIEARKSFVERFMTHGEKIELGLAPEELQDVINGWVENKYHQRDHGKLRVSPNARAASVPVRPRRIEDPRSLDILLAPAPGNTIRRVGKKGIKLDNQFYQGNCLIDWTGRQVLVRLDIRDAGRIFCFEPKKKAFIGEALDPAISGITVGDKIVARKRANKRVLSRVKALKELAKDSGDPFAEELRSIRETRAKLTNLRVGDPVTDNPFVEAANAAASSARDREEEMRGEEQDIRGTLFCKKVFPGPLPKNSQHSDPVAAGVPAGDPHGGHGGPPLPSTMEADDPKIVKFQRKEPEFEERTSFRSFLDRFLYLREKQRVKPLTDEENTWVRASLKQWISYAEMFCDQWPEGDQRWVAEIAPDHFSEYTYGREVK
jgi:hypothetical protein